MSQSQSDQKRADSITLRIITRPFVLVLFLLVSMGVSIAMELIGMLLWGDGRHWWWPGVGAVHSERILQHELNWLSRSDKGLSGLGSFSQTGIYLSSRLYYWLFQWTGIESALAQMAALPSSFRALAECVHAVRNCVQIFLVRLSITVLALPLFLIFLVWGFTEGLIRRDLRRFGGDIERAYVFHHVKRYAGLLVSLVFILYLTLPFSINPALVFVPTAFVFSLLVMATSATFIKQI